MSATPGPWRGCHDGQCQCGYVFGDGGQVYVAQAINEKNVDAQGCPDPHPTLETGLANARLISAAPDGLELARAVAAHFEGTDAPLGQMARDLIAKATQP